MPERSGTGPEASIAHPLVTGSVSGVVERPALVRYGVAILIVIVATGVALATRGLIGPFILPPYIAAVALAAWFGGLGPGLVATGISALLVDYFFVGEWEWDLSPAALPRLSGFLLAAFLISHLSARQRRIASELRGSEARMRAMLETATEGIWMLGPNGRVVYANDRMGEMLGVPASQMIGASFGDFLAPADGANFEVRLHRSLAGDRQSFDGRLRRTDGEEIAVVGGTSPVRGAGAAVVGVVGMFTDVSERERAERALARANERFSLAADAMQEMVYDWDLTTGLVYRSPGLLHVAGFRPEESEPTSAWWRDRIHPDDRPAPDRTLASLAPGEDRYETSYRVLHRDGRYRIVRDIGRLVRDTLGRPVRAVGTTVDVTEQIEAETALQLLARAADYLATETDYERTLGQVAELAVRDIADWCAVDLLDADGAVVRAASAPGSERIDAALTWRPSTAWVRSGARLLAQDISAASGVLGEEEIAALEAIGAVSMLSVPLEARGQRLGSLTMLSLTPERHFRQQELELAAHLARRSALAIENARLYRNVQIAEARYRGLFEGTTDGILVLDERFRILDTNPAVPIMLGCSRERLLGNSLVELIVSGDWSVSELSELRNDGKWRGDLDLKTGEGQPAPVDASFTRVELPDGNAFVAVLRDVSERRAMEQMQEEFLASVAHDLKNPLAAVRGQAQLLRRRLQKGEMPDPERLLTGLNGIDSGAGRMAGMIDELVDVARLRAGQALELRRQPVDLAAVVQRLVDETNRMDDHHRVKYVAPEETVVGMWDSARIERVVANLLGNAVKFSAKGTLVTVTVSRDDGWGEPCAVLTVVDEGVGIPAADLPYIFERFRRGRNVTGIRGSGIGLSGARSIVEGHGGAVSVESVEGKGSTFVVRLPLSGG
jgi:PAS domain S-box-containing protein